jgi:hypothetical protein
MVASELLQLPSPFVPELREAVREQNQRTRSGCDIMHPNVVHIGEMMFHKQSQEKKGEKKG